MTNTVTTITFTDAANLTDSGREVVVGRDTLKLLREAVEILKQTRLTLNHVDMTYETNITASYMGGTVIISLLVSQWMLIQEHKLAHMLRISFIDDNEEEIRSYTGNIFIEDVNNVFHTYDDELYSSDEYYIKEYLKAAIDNIH